MHVTITPDTIFTLVVVVGLIVKYVKSHTTNIRTQAALSFIDATLTTVQKELAAVRNTQEKTLANSVPASIVAATISSQALPIAQPLNTAFLSGDTLARLQPVQSPPPTEPVAIGDPGTEGD